jgi:hypothetical protein
MIKDRFVYNQTKKRADLTFAVMNLSEIQADLRNVKNQIKACEALLLKPFNEWSDLEIQSNGNHENLRQKEHMLRLTEHDLSQFALKLFIPSGQQGRFQFLLKLKHIN